MKIRILTLFPEMFNALNVSILKRASDQNLIDIRAVDLRSYTKDKHKKCDDYPFGGGAGMVMMAQPIYDAVNAIDPQHKMKRIFMTPSGGVLNVETVKKLSRCENGLLLLAGHYEGVDRRVIDLTMDEEISIGDYVLTGGELPAMVLCDAVCRQVEHVISSESLQNESFENGLLEYPQYTRPQEFMGIGVPEVLISGNHAEIEKWRNRQSAELTAKVRPDLLQDKKQS